MEDLLTKFGSAFIRRKLLLESRQETMFCGILWVAPWALQKSAQHSFGGPIWIEPAYQVKLLYDVLARICRAVSHLMIEFTIEGKGKLVVQLHKISHAILD